MIVYAQKAWIPILNLFADEPSQNFNRHCQFFNYISDEVGLCQMPLIMQEDDEAKIASMIYSRHLVNTFCYTTIHSPDGLTEWNWNSKLSLMP